MRDNLAFRESFNVAREFRHRNRSRDLQAEERRLRERSILVPKVAKVLRDCFDDEIDVEVAAGRIKKICPNKELQREIFGLFTTPSSEPTIIEKELVIKKHEIEQGKQRLRSWVQATRAMDALREHADAGEEDAIEILADIAKDAIQTLLSVKRTRPETVQKVARRSISWPLLAIIEPDWEDEAVKRIMRLEFGKDLEVFYTPFRAARGTDENYPARKWAKAAVRVLEETRWRYLTFNLFGRNSKSSFSSKIWDSPI
jgi:hypothetical protein